MKKIGILGLHGSREEHAVAMKILGYKTVLLRKKEDFSDISGIILPGGESSSFGRVLKWSGLENILKEKILQEKIPVFGTCAGAILLAKKGSDYSIGAIDIEIDRNAYGRQIDSFAQDIIIQGEEKKFHALFIRAPKIVKINTDRINREDVESVEILSKESENPVLVRDTKKKILVATFHPELTKDTRIHEIFVRMIEETV